jgi:hypothetical protein
VRLVDAQRVAFHFAWRGVSWVRLTFGWSRVCGFAGWDRLGFDSPSGSGQWLLVWCAGTPGRPDSLPHGTQWDGLVLELGALAVLLAVQRRGVPSSIPIWLMRMLLFKVTFMSGVRKLQVRWRTALGERAVA